MSNRFRSSYRRLDEILAAVLGVGLVLVALIPAARGSAAVGWLPMWLVGMPAVAWWALHGFALPQPSPAGVVQTMARAPSPTFIRVAPQARRVSVARRIAVRHAA